MIVTLDTDFRDLSAFYGAPPKVVLLRCGNRSTGFVEGLLRRHASELEALGGSDEIDLLEIG